MEPAACAAGSIRLFGGVDFPAGAPDGAESPFLPAIDTPLKPLPGGQFPDSGQRVIPQDDGVEGIAGGEARPLSEEFRLY